MTVLAIKQTARYSVPCYELKTGLLDFSIDILNKQRQVKLGWSWLGDSSLPVVVVLGGISADRFVAYDELLDCNGWWESFVGINKAVNTQKYSVLSFDYLGGCATTRFLESDDKTLPISTSDQAKVLKHLISKLSINHIHSIVGSSYGGMVALAFSELYPESLSQQIIISAANKSHPRSTALRQVQRSIVSFGIDAGNANQGLSLARQLGLITYRSKDEFLNRYDLENLTLGQQNLKSYLNINGEKFAKKFNPNAFLCLSHSIDSHQVEPTKIYTPSLFISVDSDELVFPIQLEDLANNLNAQANHITIKSSYGHDAFLKEHQILKPIIQSTLETEYD